VADPQEVRRALTTPIPGTAREVYLLQRTKGAQGKGLGKTWAGAPGFAQSQRVQQLSGVNYERIDEDGLHIIFGPMLRPASARGRQTVVICADKSRCGDLEDGLARRGLDPARHRRRGAGPARTRRQASDPPRHRVGRQALVA